MSRIWTWLPVSRIWTWPFDPPCPRSGHGFSGGARGHRRPGIRLEAEEVPGRPALVRVALVARSRGSARPVPAGRDGCSGMPARSRHRRRADPEREAAVVGLCRSQRCQRTSLVAGGSPRCWIAQLVARWLIVCAPPHRRALPPRAGRPSAPPARAASRGQPPSGRAPCAHPDARWAKAAGLPALQRVDRQAESSASSDRFQPADEQIILGRPRLGRCGVFHGGSGPWSRLPGPSRRQADPSTRSRPAMRQKPAETPARISPNAPKTCGVPVDVAGTAESRLKGQKPRDDNSGEQ